MGTTSFGKARYWEGSEAASIHGATSALAASVDSELVGSFATVADRNAAAAPLIAAGKKGMIAFCADAAGWCGYDGTAWRWLGAPRLLSSVAGGFGIANSTTPVNIATSGNLVVTGKRLVQVNASCYMESTATGVTAGRAFIDTGGVNNPDINGMYLQMPVEGGTSPSNAFGRITVSRSFYTVIQGTVVFNLKMLREVGSGDIYAFQGTLQVVDLGPSD